MSMAHGSPPATAGTGEAMAAPCSADNTRSMPRGGGDDEVADTDVTIACAESRGLRLGFSGTGLKF